MEIVMADKKSNTNPLEEAAANLSAELEGKSVSVKDSAVDGVQGGHVSMNDSVSRSVQAQALSMSDAAAGFVTTKTLDMRDSAIGFAASEETTVQTGNIGFLASGQIKAKEICSWVVIAGKLEGNVKTTLAPMSALAAGFGFGLALLLARGLFKRKKSPRSAKVQ